MSLDTRVRSALSSCLSSIPDFRGKGRLTLIVDRVLTDYENPRSYEVIGTLNGPALFSFDLRPWGQKFAYYYRRWESEYISALRQLYTGGVFIDVGSSLGLYVVCLGDLVRQRNGRIISIEPVSYNLTRQQTNVRLNGLQDLVDCVPRALSNQRGTVRIKTDPTGADNNAIIAEDGDVEIQTLPLDELVAERGYQNITMIKIDVEGYEPLVLEGARKTVETNRPVILAEFCRERMEINGFSIDPSWEFLTAELHYDCYVIDPISGKLALLKSPGDWENLFFLPRHLSVPSGLLA